MGPTNMVSRAIWLITPAVVIGLPYLGILCAWTTTQMPRGSFTTSAYGLSSLLPQHCSTVTLADAAALQQRRESGREN